MNFTSFTKAILENLQLKLGENYTVFSHSVKKNNGVMRTGIVAKRTGQIVSPTIYIDGFYKDNLTEKEVKKISNVLYDEFQAAEFEDKLDLSGFTDFFRAKENLAFKLISAEKNKELLEHIPHKLFHNLAVVFYYTVWEAPFFGKATILVRNQHMKMWGIDMAELDHTAFSNTPKLFPGIIESMEDVMREIFEESLKKDISQIKIEKGERTDLFNEKWVKDIAGQMMSDFNEKRVPMFVLTNRQKLYGAACLLYPEILKVFAEKVGQDFYVLPSSVHEIILVPAGVDASKEALYGIVTDINRTYVAEDEALADSVYYYNRSRNEILWLL